jgi:hypothetical protein
MRPRQQAKKAVMQSTQGVERLKKNELWGLPRLGFFEGSPRKGGASASLRVNG